MAQNDLSPSNVADDDEGRKEDGPKIDWPLVQARVPPKVFEKIEKLADDAGQKVGVWAREVLTAAAEAA